MDKNKKMIIGILTAAIVLVVAFIVYITCFDSHIEFSSKFKNGITVEYGKKFEAPKIKAYVRGRLINRKGKEIKCTIDSNVDATKTGSYEIKVTAQYGKKTATQTIKVEVRDKKAPEITLNGDAEMTVEAGSEFSDPGYTATDNYDGDLTDKVSVTGAVDTSKPGDYEIKYSVADSSKNESEVKRTVHVTDTTAPQIKLSGDDFMSVKKGDKYSDPGYTATPGNKIIYLTFDDGPGKYTQGLLDVLDKYNVKATFFVTNTHPDYQNMIAEEAKRGHTVAIHSASHKYNQIYTSEQAFFDDLEQMNSIIKAQTGNDASIIRFPGGSSNTVSKDYCPGIMTQLVNDVTARGLLYCDWNVSSGDANPKPISTEQVVQNVISGVQSHNVSVVLQHDIKDFNNKKAQKRRVQNELFFFNHDSYILFPN